MKRLKDTFRLNCIDYDVEYYYTPAEDMVMYYADGSGYPGSNAEVEIMTIEIAGYDVIDVIKEYILEDLQEEIIKYHENE